MRRIATAGHVAAEGARTHLSAVRSWQTRCRSPDEGTTVRVRSATSARISALSLAACEFPISSEVLAGSCLERNRGEAAAVGMGDEQPSTVRF